MGSREEQGPQGANRLDTVCGRPSVPRCSPCSWPRRPARSPPRSRRRATGRRSQKRRPRRPISPRRIRGETSYSAPRFEGYYQYDWNKPPDRVIPLRAYDTRANTLRHSAGGVRRGCSAGRGCRPSLRPPRGPAVGTGHRDRPGQPRQRAAARRLPQHLAGLRHLSLSGRQRTACRPTSASSPRCSAPRPTTPRTTRRSRAPTYSTSCPSITRDSA